MKIYFKNILPKAMLASSMLGMLTTVANAVPLITINVDTTATPTNTGFEFITPLGGGPVTLTVPDSQVTANNINTGTLSGPTLYSIMQDSTAPGSILLFPGLGIFANSVAGPVGVEGVQGTTGGLTTAISYIHLTATDPNNKPTVLFQSTVNAVSIMVDDGSINFEDDLTADSFVMNAGGANFEGRGPSSQKISVTNGIISPDSINFGALNGAVVEGVVEDPNPNPTLTITINKNTTFNENVFAKTLQFSNDATVTFLGGVNTDIESRFSPQHGSYGTIIFNNMDSPVSIVQNIGARANAYLKAVSILSGAELVFDNNTIYRVGPLNSNVGGTSVMGTLTIASDQSMQTFLDVKNAGTLSIAKGTTLELTSMNMSSNAFLLETGGIFTVDLSGTPGILDFPDLNNTRQLLIESASVIKVLNPSFVQNSIIYPLMTNFDLVQNDGAVITGGNNNLFTSYALTVSGNYPNQNLNLMVTVIPVNTYTNKNNAGVAGALESVRGIPLTGTLAAQEAQLFNGSIQSTAQYNDNLQTVAPVVDGGIVAGGFNLMNRTFATANDRMDYLRVASQHSAASGYMGGDAQLPIENTWIKILAQHGHQSERDGIAGYKDTSWGLSAGMDMLFCEEQVIGIGGVAFSWSTLNVHNLLSSSTTNADSYQGTLYGAMDFNNPWYLDGLVTIAYNDYEGSRRVTLGGLQYAPQAEYEGWQWGAKIESGYDYQTGPCWHTIPSLSLTYAHLEIDAYTETGANTANQTIRQQDYDMLLAGATLEFAYDYLVRNNIMFQPEVHFQVFYDFIDDAMQTTSQFTGAGPSFSTLGVRPARWSYDIGLSVVSFRMGSGLSLSLSYDYNFKEDYQSSSGFARLNYNW